MSWNPSPAIGGANWYGNTQLATRSQLISSVAGIYTDLQDISGFNFQNLYVSTITAEKWISAPIGYFSTIYAENLDVSGISILAQELSTQQALINQAEISSLSFKFQPSVDINVTVEFNVKEALFGILAGLGTLLFETFLGLGAGAGAAFQGIGNGIAAMIMANGSHNTYINQNNFELIGGSTQLQVSTLGNAYPLYSSIMRYVSTSAPNQLPGQPTFLSTFFQPGQICIRSISDPFPVMSSEPNVATSTLQQFGEWVPLAGLEPENIVANSVSTNRISTGNIATNFATASNALFYSAGVNGNLSLGYGIPLQLTIGSGAEATFTGSNNLLYYNNYFGTIFSKFGTQENASLYMGTAPNSSLLNISSINMRGNLNANSAYISSLLVNDLLVLSTFSTIYQIEAYNIVSTSIIEANLVSTNILQAEVVYPFQFSSILGNPTGPFDITVNDTVISTTYEQISSITQNILKSQLNIGINTMTSNTAAPYQVISPSNVEQWASTNFVWNNWTINGGVQIDSLISWSSPTATVTCGTFDLTILGTNPNGVQPYRVVQDRDATSPQYPSTFVLPVSHPQGYSNSYRFTLPNNSNGWWEMTTPAPPPYVTINSNALSIYQDINDTYIEGTDRLHLKAGDIYLEGTTNFGDIGVLTAGSVYTSNLTASNTITESIVSLLGVSTPTIISPYSYTGSANNVPTQQPLNINYEINSTDFPKLYPLNLATRGYNMFNSQNVSEWNNSIYYVSGTPAVADNPQVLFGECFSNAGNAVVPFTPYSAKCWMANFTSGSTTPSFFTIQALKPGGTGLLSTIGIASRNGTGYNLVETQDGQNWTVTSNVANPNGVGGYSFSNSYNVTVGLSNTTLEVLQPYIEKVPEKQTFAMKETHYTEQIRVWTNASPSYQSREGGFEYNTYFDQAIVFLNGNTYSDALNLIRNRVNNTLLYNLNGWLPIVWISRIRTKTFGIQGFDIDAVVVLIGGAGTGDFVWASARYLNVNDTYPPGDCDIRENYLMIPINYSTYNTFAYP